MATGSGAVDARADRGVQGTFALVVLAAFVFRQPWVAPVLGVPVAFGAALGPDGNPILRLYAQIAARRMGPPTRFEAARVVRAQDLLATALLGAATLSLVIGLGAIAWVFELVEAGAAAVAATTGAHLGQVALERFRRRS